MTFFRKSLQRVRQSNTLINTMWLGSSSAVSMVLNAAGIALFVRLLGVEEFGVYTLIISLMNLAIDFSEIGVNNTIVRFASGSDSRRFNDVIGLLMRFKLLLGLPVLLLSFFFSDFLLHAMFHHVDENLTRYFHLSLAAVAVSIVANTFIPIYQSLQRFRTHAWISMIRAMIKFLAIVAVLLFAATFTIEIGIWIEVLGGVVLAVLSFFFLPFRGYTLRVSEAGLQKQMFSFGKWMALHNALSSLSTRVDIFFVGMFAGAYTLGLYSAAAKITGLLIVLANSYWTALLPDISTAKGEDEISLKRKQSWRIVLTILVLLAICAGGAPVIVRILFGAAFDEAIPAVQIMCLGIAFMVASYPTNATLFARKKSSAFPLMSAASILTFAIAGILLIPSYGMIGASIAFALNGLVSLMLSLLFSHLTTNKPDVMTHE